jgi:hypothetical protein
MNGYRFWIFREKLRGVVFLLSEAVGIGVSPEDFSAIEYGIMKASRKAEDGDYEHFFLGQDDFSVVFPADPEDDDILRLWVKTDDAEFLKWVSHIDAIQAYIDSWTFKPGLLS